MPVSSFLSPRHQPAHGQKSELISKAHNSSEIELSERPFFSEGIGTRERAALGIPHPLLRHTASQRRHQRPRRRDRDMSRSIELGLVLGRDDSNSSTERAPLRALVSHSGLGRTTRSSRGTASASPSPAGSKSKKAHTGSFRTLSSCASQFSAGCANRLLTRCAHFMLELGPEVRGRADPVHTCDKPAAPAMPPAFDVVLRVNPHANKLDQQSCREPSPRLARRSRTVIPSDGTALSIGSSRSKASNGQVNKGGGKRWSGSRYTTRSGT